MAKRGRPPKYTPDLIDKVDEYLATCVDEETEFHKTRNENGSNSYERIINANIPKIEGFAAYIDVHKDTLIDWESKYDEFSVALDKIRRQQHIRLVDGSLSGRYSPVISKLLLMSNHGYKEKTDITSDDQPLPLLVQFVNAPDSNTDTDRV